MKDIELRTALIREEVVEELLGTLDKLLVVRDDATSQTLNTPLFNELYVELIDAIVDSIYVILGTAVSMGINVGEYFDEAHRSNMTKFVEGLDGKLYPIKNELGKTMKPKTFEHPRFEEMFKQDLSKVSYTWKKYVENVVNAKDPLGEED